MSSRHLKKQIDKAKEKKAVVAADVAEAYKRSTATGLNKGVMVPDGDIHRHPHQNFLVLSYCTADGSTRVKSVKDLAMKFGPGFETLDEAKKWANLIEGEDPRFDVKIVDMYDWGTVPLPDEQRPFVESIYANEILSRAMGGLQRSMVKGKKDMDERKEREMAAAERAMQKVRGKDYKMAEKSADIRGLEAKIQAEREAAEAIGEDKPAYDVIGSHELKFSMAEITEIVMEYCKEHDGETIDPMTGALIAKYVARKSLEIEAQVRRARASEFKEEDPRNAPSRDEILQAQQHSAATAAAGGLTDSGVDVNVGKCSSLCD
jgi:hypothetical protein